LGVNKVPVLSGLAGNGLGRPGTTVSGNSTMGGSSWHQPIETGIPLKATNRMKMACIVPACQEASLDVSWNRCKGLFPG